MPVIQESTLINLFRGDFPHLHQFPDILAVYFVTAVFRKDLRCFFCINPIVMHPTCHLLMLLSCALVVASFNYTYRPLKSKPHAGKYGFLGSTATRQNRAFFP
jgi:hypothetical protein